MIVAKAEKANGELVLIIGMEQANLDKMADGKPLRFNTEDYGLPPMTVAMFTGADEAELVRILRPFVGDETVIRDMRFPEGT